MPTIQHKSKTYEEFVEKFKPKKLTTDDCYTPAAIYDAVVSFVASTYGIDPATFTRPFWPGADYTKHNYEGKVVVDNPPFSCLYKIINYYNKNKIKYFMFAPALTIFTHLNKCDIVLINPPITYENGATVKTAFATNLDSEFKVLFSKDLSQAIEKIYGIKHKRILRTPRPANYWSATDCITHQQSIPRDAYISRESKNPEGHVIFGYAAVTTIYRDEEK